MTSYVYSAKNVCSLCTFPVVHPHYTLLTTYHIIKDLIFNYQKRNSLEVLVTSPFKAVQSDRCPYSVNSSQVTAGCVV